MNSIETLLLADGFVIRPAPCFQDILQVEETEWRKFADSWNDLGPDRFMADGGRYRRRRFSALRVTGLGSHPKPHQAHFQSRDHNSLNGDVQRWFDPVREETLASPILIGIFRLFTASFDFLDGRSEGAEWHAEVHQFRVETSILETGRPTPEGLHRDGVDWVLVLLIRRENVEEGVTEIGGASGGTLGRFTLEKPGDLVLLDDRKIRHGVTPIVPEDPSAPAFRDVLVVTWRAVGG